MDNDINTFQASARKAAPFIIGQSQQIFTISQVIDEGNGVQHEMKIGNLSTGDLGLISGETLYGKLVVRQENNTHKNLNNH